MPGPVSEDLSRRELVPGSEIADVIRWAGSL